MKRRTHARPTDARGNLVFVSEIVEYIDTGAEGVVRSARGQIADVEFAGGRARVQCSLLIPVDHVERWGEDLSRRRGR